MKKIIMVGLLITSVFFGCELTEEEHDPLMDVEVGAMDDYYFENDIEVNNINDVR